jgi:ketopantoate reductase
MKRRILIVGNGNIGTFLGVALKNETTQVSHWVRNREKAKQTIEVAFNDRRKRAYKIKKGAIYSYNFADTLAVIPDFDLIFVPVGHNHWREVLTALQPYLTTNQTLILSGNIWDDFDWFAENITIPFVIAFPNFGGAIINQRLEGWLTPYLTLGVTIAAYQKPLQSVNALLCESGFKPSFEKDIKGWLMTHFAYNAGMLAEAAKQNGFRQMTSKWSSLTAMYRLIRACVEVVDACGIKTNAFDEGKKARYSLWWNVLITYLIFRLPGLAKSADATFNKAEWISYIAKIKETAQKLRISTPLVDTYTYLWQ